MKIRQVFTKRNIAILLIVSVFGMLSAAFVSVYLGKATGFEVQFASLFVNSVLTIALVLVYIDISDTQKTESEILDRQEQAMRAQHLPRVRFGEVNIEKMGEDYEHISFSAKNHGNGSAQGMYLVPEISAHTGNIFTTKPLSEISELEMTVATNPVHRVDQQDLGKEKNWRFGSGADIQEDEIGKFKAEASAVEYDGIAGETVPLSKAFLSLYNAGYERVSIRLSIRFTDIFGETHQQEIFRRSIDLIKETDLQLLNEEGDEEALPERAYIEEVSVFDKALSRFRG